MYVDNDLATRMIVLANRGHPRSAELRHLAEQLNDITHIWFRANPPANTHARLVATWARARRLWRECTGEEIAS